MITPWWSVVLALLVVAVLVIRTVTRRTFEARVARARPVGAQGIVMGAEPVMLHASPTHAVLLVHGFNDTPQSLAPLAQALHDAGWSVCVPLLPGHGRPLRTFAASSEEGWMQEVRAAYATLRASHAVVTVGGLSMGAALSVLLAAEQRDIPALVLMAPYLGMPRQLQAKVMIARVAQVVFPYRRSTGSERSIHDPAARARALGTGVVTAGLLASLRDVSARAVGALTQVEAPTLYVQSREDNRISMRAAERHFRMLGSSTRELRWLDGCGHIITVDYCKETVCAAVVEWMARYGGRPSAADRGAAHS